MDHLKDKDQRELAGADSGTESTELQSRVSGTAGLLLSGLLYLLAFAFAGYSIYYVTDIGGIVFYFAILLSLIVNSVVNKDPARRGLWLALGLVPLIRIVSLVVSQPEISQVYSYILFGIPVAVCIVAIMRTLRMELHDTGINTRAPLVQTVVALSGIALGFAGYLIVRPEPLNSSLTIQATAFPALVLLVFTGFVEELAFRGVMQRAADKASTWGWAYIALVYAVLQIGHGTPLQGVFIFLVALYFGWEVKRTGSIVGVCLAHGFLNIGLFLVFPHLL